MEHLYIYYQVRPEERERAQEMVLGMQTRLFERSGQKGRILRRPELNAAGLETWMEIYEDVDRANAALIDSFYESEGLAAVIVGARHIERFVDL